MSTKEIQNETAGSWTTQVDKILIELGLTPNFVEKKGSVVMPVPKRLQSAKRQQNAPKHPKLCQKEVNIQR